MKINCNDCGQEIKGKFEGVKVEHDDDVYWLCKYCKYIPTYNTNSFLTTISLMLHELEKTIKDNK